MSVTLPPPREIVETPEGKQMLLRHCGHGVARAMYCETCAFGAPNREAMAHHCLTHPAIEHRLIAWCMKHGCYENVPPKAQEGAA